MDQQANNDQAAEQPERGLPEAAVAEAAVVDINPQGAAAVEAIANVAEGELGGIANVAEGGQLQGDIESDEEDEDVGPPTGMNITADEYDWARDIKEAIKNIPELNSPAPLSDMMIAQIALVSIADGEQGDMDKAKLRVERLQEIRKRYQVMGSLESGKAILNRMVRDLLPGFYLSFYYHKEQGCYVVVVDFTKHDMSLLDDPDKTAMWLQGIYYINQCENADLGAVRSGIVYMVECQGFRWKDQSMVQIQLFQECSDLILAYPRQLRTAMHFHTGLFLNLLASMYKKFLPSSITKKLVFGCISEHGRLDQIYLMPSQEAATQRVLTGMHQALELRYQNEASFKL